MKTLIILLFLSLTSCEEPRLREVTVNLDHNHFWEDEYNSLMWYTLEYFDGLNIVRKTLSKDQKTIKIKVCHDAQIIVAAYPLDILYPMGGYLKKGEDEITLRQEDGLFASILLESAEYNTAQVRYIDFYKAKEKLPENYDEDEVFYSLLAGEFEDIKFKNYGKTEVILKNLTDGKYIPEHNNNPVFYVKNNQETKLELNIGVHRFNNYQSNLMLYIVVLADKTIHQQVLTMPSW